MSRPQLTHREEEPDGLVGPLLSSVPVKPSCGISPFVDLGQTLPSPPSAPFVFGCISSKFLCFFSGISLVVLMAVLVILTSLGFGVPRLASSSPQIGDVQLVGNH